MLSNKTAYGRNKSFAGDFKEWFMNCVHDEDLFRVWYKDIEDCECSFFFMVNVIEIPGDYLIGVVDYNEGDQEDKTIHWIKLSEIDFALVTNEEDL